MKKIVAVTTFNHKKHYELYGKNMIESFLEFWPQEIDLYVYWEGNEPPQNDPRLKTIDLLKTCPDLVAFNERHKNNPKAHGKVKFDPNDNSKKPRGIGFQWDACRFSYKSYCITHACLNIDADIVIFLDADTKSFNHIPMDFILNLFPDNTYCSFLSREPKKYTETGFLGFNIKDTMNAEFMNNWQDFYNKDTIFNLPVFHDCECFDTIRRKMVSENKINENNISHEGKIYGHPFIQTFGSYIDHLKGNRKQTGRSSPKELQVKHNNKYWSKDKTK